MHVPVLPLKANPPLIIDTNAIAAEFLQPISRKPLQIPQFARLIELNELAICNIRKTAEPFSAYTFTVQALGFFTAEGPDHRILYNAKRITSSV
jgi:hypothetical protein